MPRLNWHTYIDGDSATVLFSSLESPFEDRTELDQSVAAIRLNDGSIIDIEWIDNLHKYRINVYSGGFESLSNQFYVESPSEVLWCVVGLVRLFGHSQSLNTTASNTTESVTLRGAVIDRQQYPLALAVG